MKAIYKPSLDEAKELSRSGNLIAVHRELPADLETPVSVYLKLRRSRGAKLPARVGRKGRTARSLQFHRRPRADDSRRLRRPHRHRRVRRRRPRRTPRRPARRRARVDGGSYVGLAARPPRLTGGAVGYFGYDLVRFMERLPDTAQRQPTCPTWSCSSAITWSSSTMYATSSPSSPTCASRPTCAAYADAIARIDKIVSDLLKPLQPPEIGERRGGNELESNLTQDQFEANVRAAKEYIAAGDIFQVVLSQRLRRDTEADPLPWRSTARRAPSILRPTCFCSSWTVSRWLGRLPRSTFAARIGASRSAQSRGPVRAGGPLRRTRRRSGICWPTPRNAPST